MRVERAVLREVPLDLREPFDTSHGRVQRRQVLLLSLHADGLVGWAECVAGSAPTYTSETTDTAWHVLTEFLLPELVGRPLRPPVEDGVEDGAGAEATKRATLPQHDLSHVAVFAD